MRNSNSIKLLILLSFGLASCTHSVHLVHVSDHSPYKTAEDGKFIAGEADQFVIFGFVFDTQYVQTARKNLEAQCSQGRIQGITTEYSTSHGFFSWTNHAVMQGICFADQGEAPSESASKRKSKERKSRRAH